MRFLSVAEVYIELSVYYGYGLNTNDDEVNSLSHVTVYIRKSVNHGFELNTNESGL